MCIIGNSAIGQKVCVKTGITVDISVVLSILSFLKEYKDLTELISSKNSSIQLEFCNHCYGIKYQVFCLF